MFKVFYEVWYNPDDEHGKIIIIMVKLLESRQPVTLFRNEKNLIYNKHFNTSFVRANTYIRAVTWKKGP